MPNLSAKTVVYCSQIWTVLGQLYGDMARFPLEVVNKAEADCVLIKPEAEVMREFIKEWEIK